MKSRLILLVTLGLSLLSHSTFADALERGFTKPPLDARPWVYWFWLNGNISSNGITADLESMKRVGVGGVLIMEVDQGAPLGPVPFMGTQWRALFQHVVAEAHRLGLEVNMNNDAGWNGSGGPWVKPEQAMQKVVASETNLAGPMHFEGALTQPETVAGFYKDITVMAFPTPGAYRLDGIRAKAAYDVAGVGFPSAGELAPGMVIARSRILDLSSQVDSHGHLAWDVPAGHWTILRLGHTCTGVENAPSPKSGRGLECDKLSPAGIEANFAGMMAKLATDNGLRPGHTGPGLVATHIDSWENGSQNWTAAMRAEFQKRRGYDPLPFLPVLTGRVIESREVSERFLWDLRQTVSELVIQNYAGRMRELAHANGMRFTVEAYGGPCDSIPYGAQSDEPMGEFWTPSGAMETCKAMSSAGHVYGKRIIGAESFTSGDQERWLEHPATLKPLGDTAFCEGINRFVFHRFALQPWAQDYRPGMTMGPWGQHYERTQTWWEWTPAWHQYLARCQFLLRQGLPVADICYVQPETPPHGPGNHPRLGYYWDECTAEAVLTRMSVKDNQITLPDGMSYRLLALPESSEMTPPLLRKLKELVAAGATIVGPRPLKSPSLNGFPQCDEEIARLSQELWGDCDGKLVKEHRYGSGRVVWGPTPERVLAQSGVLPDFTSGRGVAGMRFIHRRADGAEIYFVANTENTGIATAGSFRVAGKVPELWRPESGRIERAVMYKQDAGACQVHLALGPAESVFVVFREKAKAAETLAIVKQEGKPLLSVLPEPLVSMTVSKARYGVLNDPKRTRDVTAKVQQRVDGGEYNFPVTDMAEGDDPAYGSVKTLVVEYAIDGKPFVVRGQDPETIYLGRELPSVVIEKARYGVLDDPKRTRDMRDRVQHMVAAGERSFVVARMAEGDDPAALVVKTLELDCLIDGKPVRLSATDPETIRLSPTYVAAALPATLGRAAGGGAMLEIAAPGEYELVTSSGHTRRVTVSGLASPVEVKGPWQVAFSPGGGAPPAITLDRLASWSEHSDPGVKYFSGTATYTAKFGLPSGILASNHRLYLDLGRVQIMARVRLNGQDLGTLWKAPFHVDVTHAARVGVNSLEVQVVNRWPNRQIGDEQLAEDSERNPGGTLKQWPSWVLEDKPSPAGRFTFTSWRLWKKTDAPIESGLIGPVSLRSAECVPLKECK